MIEIMNFLWSLGFGCRVALLWSCYPSSNTRVWAISFRSAFWKAVFGWRNRGGRINLDGFLVVFVATSGTKNHGIYVEIQRFSSQKTWF